MEKEDFLSLVTEAIDFFQLYIASHTRRIKTFNTAVAVTREMSKELATVERDIMLKIVAELRQMQQVANPTQEHVTIIAEFLNEAEQVLNLQYRNSKAASEAIPVDAHKHGLIEAETIKSTLANLKSHKLLTNTNKINVRSWHTIRHEQGVDFTCLILSLAFMQQDKYKEGKALLDDILKHYDAVQVSQTLTYTAAANDSFYAYPKDFTPTFIELKKHRDSITADQLSAAIKIVEDQIPPPPIYSLL